MAVCGHTFLAQWLSKAADVFEVCPVHRILSPLVDQPTSQVVSRASRGIYLASAPLNLNSSHISVSRFTRVVDCLHREIHFAGLSCQTLLTAVYGRGTQCEQSKCKQCDRSAYHKRFLGRRGVRPGSGVQRSLMATKILPEIRDEHAQNWDAVLVELVVHHSTQEVIKLPGAARHAQHATVERFEHLQLEPSDGVRQVSHHARHPRPALRDGRGHGVARPTYIVRA